MPTWKRTYWAVWTANLITSIGMMSFLPFFPRLLTELGLTDRDEIATWAGILYGAAPLSAAVMGPLWGALGDRYGRRLMVLRSLAAITVFVGAMAFARTTWQLLALRLMQGVFSGFLAPSLTLVSVAAPRSEEGRIAGSLQTASVLGGIVGPLLGAGLAQLMPLRHVFLGVAVLSVVAALLVLAWAHEDPAHRLGEQHSAGSFQDALAGSWRDVTELWGNRTLRASLAIVFWIQFAVGTTNPILDLHVRDLFAAGEQALHVATVALSPSVDEQALHIATAVLFSAVPAVSLLAMPAWGRFGDRHGHGASLVMVAIWSGLALVAQGLAPTFALLLVTRLLFGAVMAGSAPLSFGLAAREVGVERRGGAFGVVFGARTFAVAVSAMLGGWASHFLTTRGLFVLGGITVLASAWWMRSANQRRPSLRSTSGG